MELLAQANVFFHTVWPIILFIIGLGLVIFVHELGHFIVAKWVGIKVEKFAMGFGPRILGIRRGETDYCLNLLPLGGYVKMLGQEDFKPLEDGQADPRAFNNKSIGARLAVVSAGVVMNIISAALLFVIVGLVGMQQLAPVIGAVQPGYPAADAEIAWEGQAPPVPAEIAAVVAEVQRREAALPVATSKPATATATTSVPASTSMPASATATAAATAEDELAQPYTYNVNRLQPGDRITRIEGNSFFLHFVDKDVTRFNKLMMIAALADADSVFTMSIEREVGGKVYRGKAQVGVRQSRSEMGSHRLVFGIVPAADVVIGKSEDSTVESPFQDGDRLVAINGMAVTAPINPDALRAHVDAQPFTVRFVRDGREQEVTLLPALGGGDLPDVAIRKDERIFGKVLRRDGDKIVFRTDGGAEETFDRSEVVVQKAEFLDILGMIPRLSVRQVLQDSPAQKAGIQPGDVVVSYGGSGAPSFRQFMEINANSVKSGTSIIVERRKGNAIDRVTAKITPSRRDGAIVVGVSLEPDMKNPIVASVRKDSAAAAMDVLPGDIIRQVNGKSVANWLDIFNALKQAQPGKLTLVVERGAKEITLAYDSFGPAVFTPGKYDTDAFAGAFVPRPLMGPPIKKGPIDAMAWGGKETWEFIVTTYATLRGLATGSVSTKEIAGPVGMGWLAVQQARRGLIDLIYLMAIISVSVAVLNFLPIPVVDGGHVAFLIVEKIRGKPVPIKVQNIAQMIGLALLLGVFIAVTWQDIARLIRGMW